MRQWVLLFTAEVKRGRKKLFFGYFPCSQSQVRQLRCIRCQSVRPSGVIRKTQPFSTNGGKATFKGEETEQSQWLVQ